MSKARKYTHAQRVSWGEKIMKMKSQGFSSDAIASNLGAPKGSHHYFVRCFLKEKKAPLVDSVTVQRAPRAQKEETIALLIGNPSQISEALKIWIGGRS